MANFIIFLIILTIAIVCFGLCYGFLSAIFASNLPAWIKGGLMVLILEAHIGANKAIVGWIEKHC